MSPNFIDRLVGVWEYEGRSVPDTGEVRTGGETVTRRGVWLVIESDNGARFQLAFDPHTSRVNGDFINWDDPTLWVYEGVHTDDCLTLNSQGPRMDGRSGETRYQDVWETISPDERRLTGRSFEADGTWRDFTITTYRRRS